MAMNDSKFFLWKSKETQQKEQGIYAKWAFPYGQKQRARLEGLIRALYPKESLSSMLFSFLTCKELYEGFIKRSATSEEAIEALINKTKRHMHLIKKKDLTTFAALVLADANIDQSCEYPSVDEIRAKAQELESLRPDKKKRLVK